MNVAYRGMEPRVGADAYTVPTAVVVGDVEVERDSSLWFGVVAGGDINRIRIGSRTNGRDGTIIRVSSEAPGSTHSGDDVTVGHMAALHACALEDAAAAEGRGAARDRTDPRVLRELTRDYLEGR